MLRAFKLDALRDLIRFENIDPEFLEAGGMEWWYANNVIEFLMECFRISYPNAWQAIGRLWKHAAKKYEMPVARVVRSDALSYYFDRPWALHTHLLMGIVFEEPWEKG